MNIYETLETLKANTSNVPLLHLHLIELLEDLSQAAAVHKLHHHPQLLFHDVGVNVVDDVAVVRILHDRNLGQEELQILVGERHLLDGNTPASDGLHGHEDLTRSTLANFLGVRVDPRRIRLVDEIRESNGALLRQRRSGWSVICSGRAGSAIRM
eukprot:Mycagemm_TRINITY_DN8398_c0_g1::TRINITY_DN8398_c0_g1_i1::g.5538::m.5538 type:complete len:155 gc:universal TRINITY_DN8398_c0_g1_i1:925-461(-)